MNFPQLCLLKGLIFRFFLKTKLPNNFYDYEIPDWDLGKLAMKTQNWDLFLKLNDEKKLFVLFLLIKKEK